MCLRQLAWGQGIRTTRLLDRWLDRLRDAETGCRLVLRLRKASLGQLGDVLIVMLGGGTKGTQARDIEKAGDYSLLRSSPCGLRADSVRARALLASGSNPLGPRSTTLPSRK